MMTLTPAYGRDYKSAAACEKDYLEGKDFIVADITSPWHGSYCSSRDFPNQSVKLRYKKLRSVCIATLKPSE